MKPKTYRTERRQFAEAILSRAVLVVEGSTEAALFPAASTVMERSVRPDQYTHFDLAGVTVFTASGDGDVPRYGPIFTALGKLSFGFYDKPTAPLSADVETKLAKYTQHWVSPEKGIEKLLAKELPLDVLKRFLVEVQSRADYPTSAGTYDPAATDADIRALVAMVLKARKGEAWGYASILIDQCETSAELPSTVRSPLRDCLKLIKIPSLLSGGPTLTSLCCGRIDGLNVPKC